jgi:hypothetical protein
MRASEIPEVLRHYLQDGCYAAGSLDDPARLHTFILAGHVLVGDIDGLARAWRDLRPVLRRQHEECFAEQILEAVEGTTSHRERFAAVGAITKRVRCDEHNSRE